MTRSLWFQRELFLKNIFAPFNRLWLVLLSAERKCIGIKNKLPWLGRISSRDDNFWIFFRTMTSGTRTKTGTRMCKEVNFRKIVGRQRKSLINLNTVLSLIFVLKLVDIILVNRFGQLCWQGLLKIYGSQRYV